MCHHQYDSMAYPHGYCEVKETVQSSANESKFVVPVREVMQKEALYTYLDHFKTKLCRHELSPDHNIEYTTKKILDIYWALSNALVGASHEKFRGTWRSTWPCKELHSVSLELFVCMQ